MNPSPRRAADRAAGTSTHSTVEIDGVSDAILRLKRDVDCVARDPYVSALVLGESGTGKERVARAIHHGSSRAGRPFVVVNCAALPPSLAEDALFGHVRGAFTGAITEIAGPFERADGGTVFLDEVGELPHEVQVKLLRALQERTVSRVGSPRDTAFDVRVVAATNADLRSAVQQGRFRDDLYYRLNVYELRVPPLRERGGQDLRRLAAALVHQHCERRGRAAPALAPAVWEAFDRYDWPGNVRELENALERMIVAAGGEPQLTCAHLPADFGLRNTGAATRSIIVAPPPLPTPAEAAMALMRNHFKHGLTASDLGISRHQLYRLLKRRAVAAGLSERARA